MINGDDIDDISSPLLEKSLITPELKTNKQKNPQQNKKLYDRKVKIHTTKSVSLIQVKHSTFKHTSWELIFI